MFSLRDFAEPGDEYVDFNAGTREIVTETLDDGSTVGYPAEPIDPASMTFDEQAELMRSVVLQVRRNSAKL